MDLLTHALLGAAIGELALGKRMGNRALAWGALAGIALDADAIFPPFISTSGKLWWRYGPMHSLLFVMLASWLLSKPLARLWKRQKVSQPLAWAFLFAVWYVHLLVDCFSIRGTAILWPFLGKRIAFGNMAEVDFLFTAPLLVTITWVLALQPKKHARNRRKLTLWGLGLAAGYAVLSAALYHHAAQQFETDLARRDIRPLRRIQSATPYNICLWRSVVEQPGELWVGYRSVFEKRDAPIRWTVYPKGEDEFTPLSEAKEVRRVAKFTDGWWLARRHKKGLWMADMRSGETRVWREKSDSVDRFPLLTWDYTPDARGNKLIRLPCRRPEIGENRKRLLGRIFGDTAHWDGTPRLSGITGHLSETLTSQP